MASKGITEERKALCREVNLERERDFFFFFLQFKYDNLLQNFLHTNHKI